MARAVSARRHAQAVFQIALERNELEKWQADLETMVSRLRDPQLFALLENPKLHFSEKAKFLQDVLTEISPLAMNLAYFLVAKNRLSIFDDLIIEYKRLVDAYYGIEHAEVITAIPIEERDEERLKVGLVNVIHKEIMLTTQVDPQIMGGVVVKVGDELIDASIRTKLHRLRRNLIEAGLEVR
jgi:F-type H+-transporting ATPase subunit delta